MSSCLASAENVNILKMYVEDPNLRAYYEDKISAHNTMALTNSHPDSGFDLAVPVETEIPAGGNLLLDLGVKTAMIRVKSADIEPTMEDNSQTPNTPSGFYMYPRSSLGTKTRLRLANSVGIIDSGYRGNLMASLDNIHPSQAHLAHSGDRLVQVCAPDLAPFLVELVDNAHDLSSTTRGTGGFGSTGTN